MNEASERATWDDTLAPVARGPWIKEDTGAHILTVGDYPDEPDLVITIEGGDGTPEFAAWLAAHINATECPIGVLADLVQERDTSCPRCPGVEDETWDRARKLVAHMIKADAS